MASRLPPLRQGCTSSNIWTKWHRGSRFSSRQEIFRQGRREDITFSSKFWVIKTALALKIQTINILLSRNTSQTQHQRLKFKHYVCNKEHFIFPYPSNIIWFRNLCVRRKSSDGSMLRITCSSVTTLRHQFSTKRNFRGRQGKSMRMSEIVLYILHVWIRYPREVTSHLFSITVANPCLSACGQNSNKTHLQK